MAAPILLCTDGSDLSLKALAAGLELFAEGTPVAVVTVTNELDPTLVTGTGIAGGVMSHEEYEETQEEAVGDAAAVIVTAKRSLGIETADSYILRGEPGAAICQLATDLPARAIVVGSRGRGGLKRAVLGSVSDHVVRNAPCPVLVTRGAGAGAG